ncbi:uncharacterized protein BT62DRAFT_929649 [Guyanagaster necrorhizus]|uniref:Uncharacterized protein n=1 Tax=Guyanagaster necrorhizus TaxID=856835 RepID=A0A9P8AUS7_9AGAR|nr:uncharacterized protein BT62DRAFT_929649 [Guyanagaster necrorhizus MCA 3950]KAG7448565.1 hypothetical protein BT62DRAFT_929649 [Guyanagaster necrorhizus MCA 3950]
MDASVYPDPSITSYRLVAMLFPHWTIVESQFSKSEWKALSDISSSLVDRGLVYSDDPYDTWKLAEEVGHLVGTQENWSMVPPNERIDRFLTVCSKGLGTLYKREERLENPVGPKKSPIPSPANSIPSSSTGSLDSSLPTAQIPAPLRIVTDAPSMSRSRSPYRNSLNDALNPYRVMSRDNTTGTPYESPPPIYTNHNFGVPTFGNYYSSSPMSSPTASLPWDSSDSGSSSHIAYGNSSPWTGGDVDGLYDAAETKFGSTMLKPPSSEPQTPPGLRRSQRNHAKKTYKG